MDIRCAKTEAAHPLLVNVVIVRVERLWCDVSALMCGMWCASGRGAAARGKLHFAERVAGKALPSSDSNPQPRALAQSVQSHCEGRRDAGPSIPNQGKSLYTCRRSVRTGLSDVDRRISRIRRFKNAKVSRFRAG